MNLITKIIVISLLTQMSFAKFIVDKNDYTAEIEVVFKGKKSVKPNWPHYLEIEGQKKLLLSLGVELPPNYKLKKEGVKRGKHTLLTLDKGIGNHEFDLMGTDSVLSEGNILVRIKQKKAQTFVEKDCPKAENVSMWEGWEMHTCTYRPLTAKKRESKKEEERTYLPDLYLGGALSQFSNDNSSSLDVIIGMPFYASEKMNLSMQADLGLASFKRGHKIKDFSFFGSYQWDSPLSLFGGFSNRVESSSLSGNYIFIPRFGFNFQKENFNLRASLSPLTSEKKYQVYELNTSLYLSHFYPFVIFERVEKEVSNQSYSRLRFGGAYKF